jgi:hypothetical protein
MTINPGLLSKGASSYDSNIDADGADISDLLP